MERMMSVGQPGRVGRFRPEQIAQRSTWTGIPESPATQATLGALNSVRTIRHHASTTTVVNPLDPVYDTERKWCNLHDDDDCGCPKPIGRW